MPKIEDKVKSTGGVPLLVGALCFGLVAALLAFVYLKSRDAALSAKYRPKDEQKVFVVVARNDLPAGAQVIPENFSQRQIPNQYVHDDAVRSDEFENYRGQAITVSIGRGKALLKSFMDREFPVDFSDTIEPGRRAMTVQVDEINSIAGFIRPGNHIDLFVNIPFKTAGFNPLFITEGVIDSLPSDIRALLPSTLVESLAVDSPVADETISELMSSSAPKDVIIPVLQNVRVLATGRDPYRANLDALRYPQPRTDRTFSTVTLDVDPEQAALLTSAEDKGDLLALLRNRDDQSVAEFTGKSAGDLFDNAVKMAEKEAIRRARVAVPEGVDRAGNLVDADGNVVVSRETLEAAGYSVNEKGEIIDKDGNVVDPNSIVVAADGTVINKDALAAAGYSVNESGQIVDKDGNVVDASDLAVTADGTVVNRQELAASGLSVNELGEIVDADGKIVDPDSLVSAGDGKTVTKDALEAAGYRVNENGEIIDKDGNVVDPDSIVVTANGSVVNKEDLAAAGYTVNEKGEIVDKDGNVVDPDSLVAGADGKVYSKDQLEAAGLTVGEDGQIRDASGNVIDPDKIAINENGQVTVDGEVVADAVDLIIGGDSKDGVAKSTTLKSTE